MNRNVVFGLAGGAVVVCVLIAILYLAGGTPLGHHIKHALLFLGLAVVAGFFAAVDRPLRVIS